MPWSLRVERLPVYKADFSSVATETTIEEYWKTTFTNKNNEKRTGYWVDVWNNNVQNRKDFPSKLRVMSPPTSTNSLTECSMPTAVDSQVIKTNKGMIMSSKVLKLWRQLWKELKRTDIPVLKIESTPQSKFFEAISQTTASSWLRKAFKQSQVSKVFHVYYSKVIKQFFLIQFGIYLHLCVLRKAKITFTLLAHAILILFEKHTHANKFQI